MNRYPPVKVREQLRKEVNFGCPVKGCGSPYLQYHHFDPPWNEKHHHNPEGMIALCKQHHPEADNGAWTKEQLKEMKKEPFIKNEVAGTFNWLRQDIIVMAGIIVHNPQVILKINGENVVWMQKYPDGFNRLNVTLRDSEGNLILRILNNDWNAYNDQVIDTICPPSGKELTVISKDNKTYLSIRFDDVPIADFEKRLYSIAEMTAKQGEKLEQEWLAASLQHLRESLARNTQMPETVKKDILAHHTANYTSRNKTMDNEIFVKRILRKLNGATRITTCTLNALLDYPKRHIEIKEGVFSAGGLIVTGSFFSGMKTVYGCDESSCYLGGN
jgi:hypothetical protein